MLSVGVHAAAVGVVVLERPVVAGGDPGPQAAVLAEREHFGASGTSEGRGLVGRAVVDDEHVRRGQLAAQLVQDVRQIALLVPGGDEDERVVAGCHPRRVPVIRSAESPGPGTFRR